MLKRKREIISDEALIDVFENFTNDCARQKEIKKKKSLRNKVADARLVKKAIEKRFMNNLTVIRKKSAVKTLELLEAQPRTSYNNNTPCNYKKEFYPEVEIAAWDSPTYLIRHIRHCILHRKWDNIITLLMALMKHKTDVYKNYVKEISYLIFLINKETDGGALFQEFLQFFFSSNSEKTTKNHDVWFREL